jgi:hypothetical protein
MGTQALEAPDSGFQRFRMSSQIVCLYETVVIKEMPNPMKLIRDSVVAVKLVSSPSPIAGWPLLVYFVR